MNYEKLDKIVEESVDYYSYTSSLSNLDNLFENIVPLSKKMVEEKYIPISSNNFSKSYNLNEKIELISKFLKEIDKNLYEQFVTLVSSVDDKGIPLLKFNEEVKKSKLDGETGKVTISLNNDLSDMFVILHEMIHCMNYYVIEKYEDGKFARERSDGKNYLNETAPIIAEKLFGEWLVKNNYITQNDFNMMMNRRLKNIKKAAKKIIMESIYAKLKQSDKKITKDNLEKCKNHIDDPVISNIIEEELENNIVSSDIFKYDMLMYPQMQKYVIAYNKSKDYNLDEEGINKFLELQDKLGNPESDLNKYM